MSAPAETALPARPRRWKLAALAVAGLALLTAPVWGPRLLARMAFFHVRKVEIVGLHYLAPSDILGRLRVDTTASVWDDVAPLERRVASHPQVNRVAIERRLPGTLVVRITENLPVALVPERDGMRALDADGRALPIDLVRADVDLPIVAARDAALLHLLAEVRRTSPALYARISEIRRVGRDELLLRLAALPVRAMAGVTAERLAELAPVEADLARKHLVPAELDLRYRDQVIARLP